METTHDLLVLLNKIKMDELGEKGHPFTMPQLNYFINPKRASNSYRTFTIPKKSGGVRTISAPVKMLKSFQTYTNRILQAFYDAPGCVTGFVPGKSVVDNAERHIGKNYVFNTDLKDFFPSVTKSRVWATLKTQPFSFNDTIANAIAGMSSIRAVDENGKTQYVLPQGSPCSPTLTNIVCHNLDWKLSGLARRFNVQYSRYADDITFSSDHNVYQEESDFMLELRRIIEEQNLRMNEKKTRLQKRGARQEVTGLVVSDRVNVTREYTRDLENLLYIWARHGRPAAFTKFLSHYTPKQNLHQGIPNMEAIVQGKLMYLRMVKGGDNAMWRKLQKRYNLLVGRKETALGTDIKYLYSYPIADFESRLSTSIEWRFEDGAVLWSFFKLNGRLQGICLSRYARTRLENILSSGSEKALELFKKKFYVALCQKDGVIYWMIIRKPPRPHSEILEDITLDDEVSDILANLDSGSESELPEAPVVSPSDSIALTTDETLTQLVSSDFDLNTLDKWDKKKRSS